ncbi:MAG: DNA repair protein RadA [Deltaproteobacteria bacterium]|nr:DNA repair protein RadA [Deltaproteobacteria bacterium]
MAKKTRYVCSQCGHQTSGWLGRCPSCQAWESLEPLLAEPIAAGLPKRAGPQVLSQVPAEDTVRLSTGLAELDRVLGGGLTPGAVILLSGEPGVGKSTLLLEAAAGLAKGGRRLLYVTGEESAAQVRLRAERLGLNLDQLHVLAETEVTNIIEEAQAGPWDVLAVDSIQTLKVSELGSQSGSPSQIRESAARLTSLAKSRSWPLWLVGHITKDGQIAGPKLLEHLVDTVLYFEGERDRPLRILRSFKNRFGSVNETGIFEMTGRGLGEGANPSALFLAERPQSASGSAVAPILEGHRPLLMEIQALVSPSPLAMPRRQTLGVDPARVSLLAAVLEKKVRLKLFDRDIFVNVAGGAKISEPAADLAIVAALVSSWMDKALPADLVVVGEVGLAGEVRQAGRLGDRLKEAARLGFKKAVVPALEADNIREKGLKLIGVRSVSELLMDQLGLASPRTPARKSSNS